MSNFWRSFLRYFVPGALLILLGAWFIIDSERQHRLEELKHEQRMAVGLGAQALSRHVNSLVADLDYLSRSASLRNLAATPSADHRARLEEDFANFLRARPVYDQLRWLDARGQEVARIELTRGEIRVVPRVELQNKADRYYFREAITGKPGQIFLSRLDLNVERGEIEQPHKPMLRIAMPVADMQGNVAGLLVLNYLADEMLQRFEMVTHRYGTQFSLLDGEGYWLHAEDPADAWGFMFRDALRSLPARAPAVWRQMQDSEGQFEQEGHLWTYASVFPLASESQPLTAMGQAPNAFRWLVVSRISPEHLALTLPAHRARIWLAIAVLVALLAAGATLLARQQQREMLREQRFQAIFDNAMVGMATSSVDRRWLTVNPALCRILGYDSATLLTKTWAELTHPDDLDANIAEFEATLRGDQQSYTIQKRFIRADGEVVMTDIAARIIRKANGEPDYFVVIVEDVTARQQAEHTNRLLSRRAQALLELPKAAESMDEPDFMQYAIDQAERLTDSKIGFIHFINDDGKSIELVAWSISTLANYCHAVFDRHYPLDEAGIWAEAARIRQPVIVNDYATAEARKGLPDGHAHLERFISVPVVENTQVRMILGVGNRSTPYLPVDVETAQLIGSETWRIVQRQRSERALQAASQVVNASPIVCFRWRAVEGWPIEYVSDNVRQWGYSPEDLLAGDPPYTEMVHPDDLARIIAEVKVNTAAGATGYEQEYRLLTADGRVLWVVDRTRVVRGPDNKPQYYDGVVTDITERKQRQSELTAALGEQRKLNKRLEEANNQLMQSEKMASIGQLAAGVAHELNNPIGFVHSNLGTLDAYLNDLMSLIDAYQTLADETATGTASFEQIARLKEQLDFDYLRGDIFQLVSESKDGLSRVKKIVQDLKSFSRVGEQEWQAADLHQGIDSTLNIVWNELKYKCQVVKDYGDLPPVFCLISQLNQVFMNLLVNAGHAIEKQGTITIRTRCDGEDRVVVEVSDTGSGIPKENLTRIFDPFFTTKPVGKGTGLGLSLSYSIIERHHGRFEVESEVGVGTTFRVILPVTQAAAGAPGTEEKSA